jgi:hypothetical protein
MGEVLDEAQTDALVQKVRIILANSAHLERMIDEEFHRYRRVKLHQEENVVSVNAGGMSATFVEPSVNFAAGVDLACNVLNRINLPFDRSTVQIWVVSACSTFAHTKTEADNITGERVRFIVDWVLKCLADSWLRQHPEKYYRRQFLLNFRHPTGLADSGLQLSGPVAHGIFGTIWLHAKTKRSGEGRCNSQVRRSQRADAPYEPATPRRSFDASNAQWPEAPRAARDPRIDLEKPIGGHHDSLSLPEGAKPPYPPQRQGDTLRRSFVKLVNSCPMRGNFVVLSISKTLCRLPPEIMSKLIHDLIEMEPLPYVLPLLDAFEDLEHIHLVYAPVSNNCLCLIDFIFDQMHQNNAVGGQTDAGFSEYTVQVLVKTLMMMLKTAHSRGLVHAGIRMGGIFLDDSVDLKSMKVLEFGLYNLFHTPPAIPPLSIITPLELDPSDPVPPYRRDFQCLAEIMYLLMGGQPICPPDCSLDFRRQRFRCGTASFADKVYARCSESAKSFLLELLKPAQFQKPMKLRPSQLAEVHILHRWLSNNSAQELDETFDMIVMRRYDTWRNTVLLQTRLVKLVADRVTLASLSRLWQHLQSQTGDSGNVSWLELQNDLQSLCSVPHDLLKKVNKAYGDSATTSSINITDLCNTCVAWRQKRVREVLWQPFARAKCLDGTMPAEACLDGLTSGVLPPHWSRPTRIIDIVFPLAEQSSECEHKAKLEHLMGKQKQVSYLDLVAKTDAAGTLWTGTSRSAQFFPLRQN